MARRRKIDPERKAFISSLLEHYQPKDAQDVQDMLKDLLGKTLQGVLILPFFRVVLFYIFSFQLYLPHATWTFSSTFLSVIIRIQADRNVYPYLFYSFLTFLQVHQPEGFGEEGWRHRNIQKNKFWIYLGSQNTAHREYNILCGRLSCYANQKLFNNCSGFLQIAF